MRIFERSIAGLPPQQSTDLPTASADDPCSDCSLLACTEEVSVASGAPSRSKTVTGSAPSSGNNTDTPIVDEIGTARNSDVVTELRSKDAEPTLTTTQDAESPKERRTHNGCGPTHQGDVSTGKQLQYQPNVKCDNVGQTKSNGSWHRYCNDNGKNFCNTYLKRRLRTNNERNRACCHARQLLPNRCRSYCNQCGDNKPVSSSIHASRSNESLYSKTNISTDDDSLLLSIVSEETTISSPESSSSTGATPLAEVCPSDVIRARDNSGGKGVSRECSDSRSRQDREKRIKILQRQLNVLQQELLTLGGCDLEITYV